MWYKIKSKIINFFSNIRIYAGGVILFGESSYQIKGPDMRIILSNLQKGDILLRRYSHYLGSVLIKGYYSHAAIYVGDNKVIHMLSDGITSEDILTFLRCDDICILRYNDHSKINEAIETVLKFENSKIEYDFNFDSKCSNKLYCTELVNCCYNYPIKITTNHKYILPDDFLECESFSLVWRKIYDKS